MTAGLEQVREALRRIASAATRIRRSSERWGPPIAVAVLFRLFYSVWAALFLSVSVIDPKMASTNAFADDLLSRSDGLRYWLLGPWERFDALWYIHIATAGYDRAESVVFFPLYPILIQATGLLTQDMLLAAVAVSTVSVVAFFLGLYALGSLDLNRQQATRTLALAAAWPASFVLFGGYPEPLLLALLVWSFYWARAGRWRLATICALGAAATKAIGVTVVVPLALMAWRGRHKRAWPIVLVPMVPALIAITHAMHGGITIGAAYERYWGTVAAVPWTSLTKAYSLAYESGYAHPVVLQLLAFTAALVISLAAPLRSEYKVFVLAAALVIASKDAPVDQQQWARYALIFFPAHMGTARSGKYFAALIAALMVVNLAMLQAFILWSSVV